MPEISLLFRRCGCIMVVAVTACTITVLADTPCCNGVKLHTPTKPCGSASYCDSYDVSTNPTCAGEVVVRQPGVSRCEGTTSTSQHCVKNTDPEARVICTKTFHCEIKTDTNPNYCGTGDPYLDNEGNQVVSLKEPSHYIICLECE